MDRLDYYDITPKGMDAYLSAHGHHFSKPMLEWAVSMMRDRKGVKQSAPEKKKVDEKLRSFGVELDQDKVSENTLVKVRLGGLNAAGDALTATIIE